MSDPLGPPKIFRGSRIFSGGNSIQFTLKKFANSLNLISFQKIHTIRDVPVISVDRKYAFPTATARKCGVLMGIKHLIVPCGTGLSTYAHGMSKGKLP